MHASPYRTAAERSADATSVEHSPDRELVPVFAVLWLASVARVVEGLLRQEIFGAEATAAAIAVVLLPSLAREGFRGLWRDGPNPIRAQRSGREGRLP